MTTYRRHTMPGAVTLLTILAASLWFAVPTVEAQSRQPGSLSLTDDAILEISTLGSIESGAEGDPDGVGTRDEYERALKDVPVSSPAQYINDGSGFDFETRTTRLIGITVDDEKVQHESRSIKGIIIVKVINNSPAAHAGLRGERTGLQNVLEAGVVACSVFFPPGFMALPLIEEHDIGKRYDLIIGVDGERVRDVLALDEALKKAEPGEIVYLSVIRDSRRLQIPVLLPGLLRVRQ